MLTKILLPLGKFFEGNIGAIVTKALSFIGVGVLTYGALTTAFNAALTFTQSHYNGLAPDILALVGLGGFGEAAGIIVGAMAGKIAMQSFKKLGLLPS